MFRITGFALLALFIGAGGAFAESGLGDDEGGTTATITTTAGTGGSSSSSESGDGGEVTESGFDSLSPGNRKIAEALYQGQSDGGDESLTGWSRDDIGLAKQDGQGWGQIFKQMKEDGLVDARNLGQLVSKHNSQLNTSLNNGSDAAQSEPSLDDIDDGGGATTISGGDGEGVGAGTSGAEGSEAEPGTYKALSPGGQKIAEALFDAQKPVEGSGDVWSVDQIAAANQDGQRWGEIFKQMKQDQLFQERNLGQLVSGQGKIDVATATGAGTSGLLVTDGAGKSGGKASVGKGGTRGGKYNVSTAGGTRGDGIGGTRGDGIGGSTGSSGWHGRGVVTAGGASVGGQSASATSSGDGKSSSARGRIK